MAAPTKSTRSSLKNNVAIHFGPGKEFLQSEVPTVRAVLQKGILIQEQNLLNGIQYQHYPINTLCKNLVMQVICQWEKSNPLFKPPVILHYLSIFNKINLLWTKANDFANGKLRKSVREEFIGNLDKLFDIIKCTCPIVLCNAVNFPCNGCNLGAHISCKCNIEFKILKQDLIWVYYQRLKTGERSQFQFGGVDLVESKRQYKRAQREKEERDSAKNQLEENIIDAPLNSDSLSTHSSNNSKNSNGSTVEIKQNCFKISHTAAASIRFRVSDRATAAVVSAFLQDLIENRALSKDMNYLVCDKNKIFRAKESIIRSTKISEENRLLEEEIQGLFFDGKKDSTLALKLNEESAKNHPAVKDEEHYTLTQEPQGKYVHHFTPEPAEDPHNPAAKQIAKGVFDWISSHEAIETLMVIGGDSTNTITGYRGGAIAFLEEMLEHKLHWSICMLHTNELPLRRLIKKLDGWTTSATSYSGPIGKLLPKVNDISVNYNFRAITGGEDLIDIPEHIIESLSTDQKNCYLLVNAVKSGNLDRKLASIKCGPLNHSRWLTTGQALLMLWTRNHGLEGEILKNFELIIDFVIKNYFKLYFDIKVNNSILEGPNHILTALRLLRNQPEEVQEIVKDTIIRGSYHAHSENVLLTLLASKIQSERQFAIGKILKIRGSNDYGDINVRQHVNPKINFEATELTDLISWDKCYEPVFTCNMDKREIRRFRNTPMVVPYFPIHTQSTERAIQIVSQAAKMVVGQEKRDGYVRQTICSRDRFPIVENKKTLMFS